MINRIRGAVDSIPTFQSSQQRERRQNQDGKQEKKKEEGEKREFDAKEIEAAISAFTQDLGNKGAGITAVSQGHGPGLKVILKDGTGAVVRQMSGEEFVQLKEAAADRRGKILDQKL